MAANILEDIVIQKRDEVEAHKRALPVDDLERLIALQPTPTNLSGALMGDRIRLITEIKKASPSKGLLCPEFNPTKLATIYTENNAAAISVLTDHNFQGTLEHLSQVKAAVLSNRTPVLRKDFLFDPYQLYEARAYGADAVLLIASILNPELLKELLTISQRLWVQCLVEIHNEEELEIALWAGAEIIGINNRDLHTFHTDFSVTETLAPLVPKQKIIVSESGISTVEHITKLKRLGVHAALIGEALLTASDIGSKVRQLSGCNQTATSTPPDSAQDRI